MDYQELSELIPKSPAQWSQEDVLKWLKHIGYEQLDTYFMRESIDGSSLLILCETDLTDMGIQSGLQRKKLMQWIKIGLVEYGNYLRLNMAQSRVEYDVDEQIKVQDIEPQHFVPSQRPIMNIESVRQPSNASQSIPQISEEELYKQVQIRKNIFDTPPKAIIKTQLKSPIQEEDHDLPHFGTPKFQHKSIAMTLVKPQQQPKMTINGNATIGRTNECTLVLPSESVSRTHLFITYQDGLYYMQDKGSLIGTYIFIQETALSSGSIILMGSNEFIVQQFNKLHDQCSFNLSSNNGSLPISLKLNQSITIGNTSMPFLHKDSQMSTQHAILTYSPQGLQIKDLNSQNGTWMRLSSSGQQSQIIPIDKRQIIRIADFVIIIDV